MFYNSYTFDNDSLISMSFATFISSWFTFLPRLSRVHNKIDLISEKEIFLRSQDIGKQYSCFRFDVIISANTD